MRESRLHASLKRLAADQGSGNRTRPRIAPIGALSLASRLEMLPDHETSASSLLPAFALRSAAARRTPRAIRACGRRTFGSAARNFSSSIPPARRLCSWTTNFPFRRRRDRGIYRRDARRRARASTGLLPSDPKARAEARRIANWFHEKFFTEVSEPLAREKIFKLRLSSADGGGPPDSSVLQAAKKEYPLSSAICRLALEDAKLACFGEDEFCRSRRGRASFGRRLPG